MISDVDVDAINLDSENLEEILSLLKLCVSMSVDKHAQEKLLKMLFRDSQPWFNQELQDLKRLVCNREMIWHKYKKDHQWCAYKDHHWKYTEFLRMTRLMHTQAEIAKFKGKSKHLYKLIVELTGSKTENPLPDGLSDGDLAKCFVEFFIIKIKNIRDNLNSHSLYNLIENCATGKLSAFKLLSAQGIRKVVGRCKQDHVNWTIYLHIYLRTILTHLYQCSTRL